LGTLSTGPNTEGIGHRRAEDEDGVGVRILGRKTAEEFALKHADIRSSLNAWIAEVSGVRWHGPSDVKARYPSASLLGDNRIIFNLKGTKYRLEVRVAYQTKVVLIRRLGTHAEYGRWDI
jgi:mRNA interferase HigB